ncbi:MAG: transcription termination/antitermination NusG family protein [Hyphomicrobiaceae bacterium]|nr:transcription termination/antitermination NusG family protein [Hyphomicrobiaceae bacterium]
MGRPPTETMHAAWAVATTHPHSEAIAVGNLRRQGFDVYCPQIRRRRSHARRIETVLRPLFPGYVFVGLAQGGRWRAIASTGGVRALVKFGDAPATLAGAFVDGLKAQEIDGAVVRPAEHYTIGQAVQIAGGPFDGLVARILELDERDRIVVLLEVMNRGVKTQVEPRQLAPALGV